MTKLNINRFVEIQTKKEINFVNESGNRKGGKLYQST